MAKHHFCVVCGIYPFHKKRSMPNHYGVNTACLEDFDPAGMAVRKAEGLGMSVVASDPRPQWTGPRGS